MNVSSQASLIKRNSSCNVIHKGVSAPYQSLNALLESFKARAVRWKAQNGNASGMVLETSKGPVGISVEHVFRQGGKPIGFYSERSGLNKWKGTEIPVTVYDESIDDGITFFGSKLAIIELLHSLYPLVPKDYNDAYRLSSSGKATIHTYRLNRPGVDLIRGKGPDSQSEKKAFSTHELTYRVNVLTKKEQGYITTDQTSTQFGADFADHGTSGSYAKIFSPSKNEPSIIAFLSRGSEVRAEGRRHGHETSSGGSVDLIPITQKTISEALSSLRCINIMANYNYPQSSNSSEPEQLEATSLEKVDRYERRDFQQITFTS